MAPEQHCQAETFSESLFQLHPFTQEETEAPHTEWLAQVTQVLVSNMQMTGMCLEGDQPYLCRGVQVGNSCKDVTACITLGHAKWPIYFIVF